MVLLGRDILGHISNFDTDVLKYNSDEDKYNRLIELHPGFDQWEFFYELLRFSRLVGDFIEEMKTKTGTNRDNLLKNLNDFYDPDNNLKTFNTSYAKLFNLGSMKKYAITVFHEHPYMDYALVLDKEYKDYKYLNVRPLIRQEFNKDLWKTINDMVEYHKKDLPFIYDKRGMPLDFLLRKWNKIYHAPQGSTIKDLYTKLEQYNVDRVPADTLLKDVGNKYITPSIF